MKKVTTIRSIVSMMLIFFAAAATSCQKESEIAPSAPSAPVVPVIPAVSFKPSSIITTVNGSAVRKEAYAYDAQGKLLKYESLAQSGASDSVLLSTNNIRFKTPGSTTINQSLVLNPDKTFKSLFTPNDQIDFVNNGNKMQSMQRIRPGNTPQGLAEFAYTNNNLSVMGAEARIDINYHDNLPYQKGINEIPVPVKPIKYYKIMEMENATTTLFYNKLIRQVIIDLGSRRELHEYTYTFDANNRVTQIMDIHTVTTSTSSAQRILVSTISYAQN